MVERVPGEEGKFLHEIKRGTNQVTLILSDNVNDFIRSEIEGYILPGGAWLDDFDVKEEGNKITLTPAEGKGLEEVWEALDEELLLRLQNGGIEVICT